MSADPARAALDAAVGAWIAEVQRAPAGDSAAWEPDDARFDALARELFAFQFERCAPFRRLCASRGRTPDRVAHWREIPPVPAGAFKEMALRSFPAERTVHTFLTSGTATRARGALHLDTLDLYEASLRPPFERFVLPDLPAGERLPFVVLAPSRAEAPDSSLTHMFDRMLAARGAAGSAFERDPGAVQRRLERLAETGAAACLAGTAFAFVHLLDHLEARGTRLALPPGTRIMETGGFKGRSREVSRDTLYAGLEQRLGVPPARVVNQYGMTELASQFYDSVLARPGEPRRKLGPPWARVRIVDPASGADAEPGAVGSVCVVDLANTGSVLAVQTADLGRRAPGTGDEGFEILGREPGAEARGCSIAADAMLGGSEAAEPAGP